VSSRILIIDDEESISFSLHGVLEDEGHQVLEAATGEAGLALAEAEAPDLVFLDIWLPGLDGLAVLEALAQFGAAPPVVMISGHGTIETAVAAIKKGAFDFIEKPLSLEKVVITANKALEFQLLRQENLALRSRIAGEQPAEPSGSSEPVLRLRGQIQRVAPTDAWVLITGENGTGKEIVARSIHAKSRRRARPLVAVNCAAIPEDLIESELFGHEKGAYTGAESAQSGKFEMAHRGTLFLDEIGDMSLSAQAKILRILQEQSFERVGGRKTIRVDVRVIAATNKDLAAEIQAGKFREDLYYRLKVFPLHVPPLRQRPGDIALLIEEFVVRMAREHGLRPIAFSPEAMRALTGYPWPGNVRELKNFVERMHIMHLGGEVALADLPAEYVSAAQPPDARVEAGDPPPAAAQDDSLRDLPADFKAARSEFEARFLEARLKEAGGSVTRLAEAIGMERSYLYRKLKSHGINPTE